MCQQFWRSFHRFWDIRSLKGPTPKIVTFIFSPILKNFFLIYLFWWVQKGVKNSTFIGYVDLLFFISLVLSEILCPKPYCVHTNFVSKTLLCPH